MRNCCGCSICYLAFLVSNVEKLERYFLSFLLNEENSKVLNISRGLTASAGLSPGWRSPGDCPCLTAHLRHRPEPGASAAGVECIQYNTLELQTKVREDFTITEKARSEKAHTRAFSWLNAPISAFKFKTLRRPFSIVSL